MKSIVSHALLLGVVIAVFCSCETTTRNLRFNETDFAAYAGVGSSEITGRAAGIFDKNTPRVADHLEVQLIPDTAYTQEVERIAFRGGEEVRPRDPRFAHYVRETKTDGDGHFTFTGIPAGRYYVTCRFTWPYKAQTYQDDRIIESDNLAQQTLYAKLTVAPGQAVRVEHWDVSVWFAMPIH